MEIWMETNEFESKQIKDIEEVMKKMELSLKDDAPLDNEQEKDAVAKEIGDATMASTKTKSMVQVFLTIQNSIRPLGPILTNVNILLSNVEQQLHDNMAMEVENDLYTAHHQILDIHRSIARLLKYMDDNAEQFPAELLAELPADLLAELPAQPHFLSKSQISTSLSLDMTPCDCSVCTIA